MSGNVTLAQPSTGVTNTNSAAFSKQ
jgi:hypothetical protein